MACPATWKPSIINAIPSPVTSPTANSATTHSARSPNWAAVPAGGHSGIRQSVSVKARTTRLILGPAFIPGKGTNTRNPDTRARASRKLYKTRKSMATSVCIAAEVPEKGGGIRNELRGHPWKKNQESKEECHQLGHRSKAVVLDGRDDLNQTDDYTRAKTEGQQRHAQTKGRHERLMEQIDCRLRSHAG